jgi:hypothetical protein
MALQLNSKVDIITPDDRIIRNVGYAFLKPFFSSKTEVEVECIMYEDKTDVFPKVVITQDENGNDVESLSTTKNPKGAIKFNIVANMTDTDLVEKIHTEITNKLIELNSNISINIDAI